MARPYIWLHIKKAAGQSMRTALGDSYVQTLRRVPTPFAALPKEQWNDNLNNFRVPLGDFDYRRMLFAKKCLYEDFDARFKFAIVRNPFDRAVSCWRYLTKSVWRTSPRYWWARRSFSYFLAMLPEVWESRSDRHIATHTAPMWPDICGENGELLLDFIGRLESINDDFRVVCEKLDIPFTPFPHVNKRQQRAAEYRQAYDRRTRASVERLFADDIQRLGYDF